MWYSASLFFEGVHTDAQGKHENLWEESIYLIFADTQESASEKANAIGVKSQMNYAVSEKDSVNWRFIKVERIVPIDVDELKDGTELLSRFLRASEARSLLTPFED